MAVSLKKVEEPIRISRAEAGECSTTPETTGGEASAPPLQRLGIASALASVSSGT
jgi:hypothetical protein